MICRLWPLSLLLWDVTIGARVQRVRSGHMVEAVGTQTNCSSYNTGEHLLWQQFFDQPSRFAVGRPVCSHEKWTVDLPNLFGVDLPRILGGKKKRKLQEYGLEVVSENRRKYKRTSMHFHGEIFARNWVSSPPYESKVYRSHHGTGIVNASTNDLVFSRDSNPAGVGKASFGTQYKTKRGNPATEEVSSFGTFLPFGLIPRRGQKPEELRIVQIIPDGNGEPVFKWAGVAKPQFDNYDQAWSALCPAHEMAVGKPGITGDRVLASGKMTFMVPLEFDRARAENPRSIRSAQSPDWTRVPFIRNYPEGLLVLEYYCESMKVTFLDQEFDNIDVIHTTRNALYLRKERSDEHKETTTTTTTTTRSCDEMCRQGVPQSGVDLFFQETAECMCDWKKLKLGFSDVTDDGLQELSLHCNNLHELRLTKTKVTDAGVKEIARRCPKLQKIVLDSSGVGDASVKELVERCPALTELHAASTLATNALKNGLRKKYKQIKLGGADWSK